jgi:hypothetical protein
MSAESIESILHQLSTQSEFLKKGELHQQIADYINYLLINDFSKLVQILYRIDVNEQKLKQLLQENPKTDAAVLIADLLFQRQEEKIKAKESFTATDDIPEDEKW